MQDARIALATESKLDLANIADSEACDDGLQQVRKSLALWKLLTENDPPKNRNFFVGYVDASLSFRVSPNVILAPPCIRSASPQFKASARQRRGVGG